MSSDLLKEFGGLDGGLSRTTPSQSSANIVIADEDDFGDFEEPENEDTVSHIQSSPSSLSYLQSSTPEVQDARMTHNELGNSSLHSVIFDAEEAVIQQKKKAERTARSSLLPATIRANDSQGPQTLSKPRLQASKNAPRRRVEASKATAIESPIADDEPWVDFDAAEAAKPSNTPSPQTPKAAKVSTLGPPPSNIPPPSILLPIITKFFESLAANLKTISSHQPPDQPNTLPQLHTLLSTTRAASRILAGRKLRWKRDTLLSQSMKIGPAPSGKAGGGGGGGGMKLAGVDRAESRREDQEAAEALQAWKLQLGPLRATVAALNAQLSERERVRIAEVFADGVPVRQGRPGEGVVTAPKCCFLCGVKRDERVVGVDVDVEDSFGEWWVEHWGHVDCVAFWENYKGSLRQR